MSSVFERIIQGELPAKKVWESAGVIAIEDIAPVAPVHILIIPKKHFPDLQSIPKEDLSVMAEVVEVAQILAKRYGIEDRYRLLTNNGEEAGQAIFHLHFHLIGGRRLSSIG